MFMCVHTQATSISPLFKPLLRVYHEKGHVLWGHSVDKMEGSAEWAKFCFFASHDQKLPIGDTAIPLAGVQSQGDQLVSSEYLAEREAWKP